MKLNKRSFADVFYNAETEIFKQARVLRKEMTLSERILWNELRAKKLNGLRFRRQHPVSRFIVDFYCHSKRLVIELDGEIHESEEARRKDESRTNALTSVGLQVIRFKNEEILYNVNSVLLKIIRALSD